jgi:hypothetical protein
LPVVNGGTGGLRNQEGKELGTTISEGKCCARTGPGGIQCFRDSETPVADGLLGIGHTEEEVLLERGVGESYVGSIFQYHARCCVGKLSKAVSK